VTRSVRDERGSALVEFALVVPVFVLVLIGSMSIVWLVGARSAVTGAARDGARFASIQHDPLACEDPPCPTGYPTADEVRDYVEQRVGIFGVDSVTVSDATYRNEVITVTARRTLPNVFRAFGALLGFEDVVYTTTVRVRAE